MCINSSQVNKSMTKCLKDCLLISEVGGKKSGRVVKLYAKWQ